jgi:hypothetical protein
VTWQRTFTECIAFSTLNTESTRPSVMASIEMLFPQTRSATESILIYWIPRMMLQKTKVDSASAFAAGRREAEFVRGH